MKKHYQEALGAKAGCAGNSPLLKITLPLALIGLLYQKLSLASPKQDVSGSLLTSKTLPLSEPVSSLSF